MITVAHDIDRSTLLERIAGMRHCSDDKIIQPRIFLPCTIDYRYRFLDFQEGLADRRRPNMSLLETRKTRALKFQRYL